MARVIIRPGTDIKALKKRLKKRGYVLRAYKQCDGSILYRLHRNSYLPAGEVADIIEETT